MHLTPVPGATKAVLVKTDDAWLIQWRAGGRRMDVTRLPEAELASELGGRTRDADTIAYIERRLNNAGFVAKLRSGHRDLLSGHEVAAWQLRPRLR